MPEWRDPIQDFVLEVFFRWIETISRPSSNFSKKKKKHSVWSLHPACQRRILRPPPQRFNKDLNRFVVVSEGNMVVWFDQVKSCFASTRMGFKQHKCHLSLLSKPQTQKLCLEDGIRLEIALVPSPKTAVRRIQTLTSHRQKAMGVHFGTIQMGWEEGLPQGTMDPQTAQATLLATLLTLFRRRLLDSWSASS